MTDIGILIKKNADGSHDVFLMSIKAGAPLPDILEPRTARLSPGVMFRRPIDRLIAGRPGAIEYIYLTEPGEYTVKVVLRLTVDGKPLTIATEPVRVRVKGGG